MGKKSFWWQLENNFHLELTLRFESIAEIAHDFIF